MALKPETIAALRKPFAAEGLRWKIQQNPYENSNKPNEQVYALVVVYVDARSVSAHLDDVTGGDWFTEYRQPPVTVGAPALECRLTVCGVTRSDVGAVVSSGSASSMDTKDLYSDALKRAAVQFGVGAFLYRFPTVKAAVSKSGKNWYLTKAAKVELKDLASRVLEGRPLTQYQHIKVTGYDPDGVSQVTLEDDDEPVPVAQESSAHNDYQKCQEDLMQDFADMQSAATHDDLKSIFRRAWNRAARHPELQKDAMAVKDKRKQQLDAMQSQYSDIDQSAEYQPVH